MLTTEHRGVFLAKIDDNADITPKTLTNMKDGRMVIQWRNGEGLQGMAASGPTAQCKLGPIGDIEVLHDITAVFHVTDLAAAKIWG